ncbi:hypothetical protein [Novosphingobium sp.]|uniref:hypothetical protein n=1 Tax=Novosphingobium sp. TaxID=1874826 RepID=UPI0025D2364E|nr:hypothetical protein [Novosphingobium sp.]
MLEAQIANSYFTLGDWKLGLLVKGCLPIIIVALLVLVVSAFLGSTTRTAPLGVPVSSLARRDRPTGIEENAADPYTQAEYPQTIKQFGSVIAKINDERRKAAGIAATYAACDRVSNVQISQKSSKKRRRYWADCSNMTRVYLDADSVSRGDAVTLQTQADMEITGLKEW